MASKHHEAAQTGHERGSRRVAIEGHTRTLAGQPAILNPRRAIPAVGTNIVVFRLTHDGRDAGSVVSRARGPGGPGVRLSGRGPSGLVGPRPSSIAYLLRYRLGHGGIRWRIAEVGARGRTTAQ